MKLKTNILLVVTASIIALMFLLATFAPMLNLDDSYPKKLVFVWILVFAVNVLGLTLGVVEHKKGRKKALIGGNWAFFIVDTFPFDYD